MNLLDDYDSYFGRGYGLCVLPFMHFGESLEFGDSDGSGGWPLRYRIEHGNGRGSGYSGVSDGNGYGVRDDDSIDIVDLARYTLDAVFKPFKIQG